MLACSFSGSAKYSMYWCSTKKRGTVPKYYRRLQNAQSFSLHKCYALCLFAVLFYLDEFSLRTFDIQRAVLQSIPMAVTHQFGLLIKPRTSLPIPYRIHEVGSSIPESDNHCPRRGKMWEKHTAGFRTQQVGLGRDASEI